jgi:hypothetical protein
MTERDEWISQRAHALWEEAGRPEGESNRHWEQAVADWQTVARKTFVSRAGARLINDFPASPVNEKKE